MVHGVWHSQGFAPQDSQSSPTKSHPRQSPHVNPSLYPTSNTSVSPFRCLSLTKPVRQVTSVQPPEGPYWLLVVLAGVTSDVICPGQPHPHPVPALMPPAVTLLTWWWAQSVPPAGSQLHKDHTPWHRWTDAWSLGPPLSPRGLVCCCLVMESCPTLLQPHGLYVAHQVPLSIGFPRQDYWSRLLFPTPGELTDPEIKPESPSLAGRFFTTEPPKSSLIK